MMNEETADKAARSHTKAKAKAKAESRNAEQSCPKPGTWEVQAKCVGGAWEANARYMGGTWEVHAWYMRGTSHAGAMADGRWQMVRTSREPPQDLEKRRGIGGRVEDQDTENTPQTLARADKRAVIWAV
jgi:hypothetical protein